MIRNITITVMASAICKVVGWTDRRAAIALAMTQANEPMDNWAANMWAWTHSEWTEADVVALIECGMC